jgi:hypothetical protein
MAALRIGHLAVDGAHVVVGLQWITAPTAQVRRCHSNQVSRLEGIDGIPPRVPSVTTESRIHRGGPGFESLTARRAPTAVDW